MRPFALAALLALALAAALPACSITPAQREAITKAWADHDAEIAAECRRNHVGYAAGGCTSPF